MPGKTAPGGQPAPSVRSGATVVLWKEDLRQIFALRRSVEVRRVQIGIDLMRGCKLDLERVARTVVSERGHSRIVRRH